MLFYRWVIPHAYILKHARFAETRFEVGNGIHFGASVSKIDSPYATSKMFLKSEKPSFEVGNGIHFSRFMMA